ncbi:MAG: hypothetical protein VZR25_06180 [Acutalibacteraceae bacterium]|jgi:hypothetical protein|nr:hypothetical protein [Clostridia bacterium]MEE1292320.1 hypothetical protein [Acutalibacteraceae bacterium]MEE3374718.1 hypothetical protein [Acutalibacteraceae bacterium]NLD29133.1 hypothetical protein [Clostridiales bacterium]
MKRSLTAFIGIVLMLAMTLALVGCNKKTDETVTVTTAAPTVVTQQAEEATEALQNQSATQKATQKATEKATKKATKKATQKSTKKATQKTTEKATQKTTEATGSPVQRFQGRYGSDRCTVDVKGVANNTVEIHIYWASSAWEHSEWTMSGNFDEDSKGFYVYYSDGVRKDYKFNDDGEQESVETVYTGGKGAFRFNGNKMTWDDQAEHIADGMVFTK